MAGNTDSEKLRELAAGLRQKHAEIQAEKMVKVGHILNAARGLKILKEYLTNGT